MFRELPKNHDKPAKADGEGWLVSSSQEKLVRFKNDTLSAHAEWVSFCTYSWKPLSPPVPMTQRRMLRHKCLGNDEKDGLAAIAPTRPLVLKLKWQ